MSSSGSECGFLAYGLYHWTQAAHSGHVKRTISHSVSSKLHLSLHSAPANLHSNWGDWFNTGEKKCCEFLIPLCSCSQPHICLVLDRVEEWFVALYFVHLTYMGSLLFFYFIHAYFHFFCVGVNLVGHTWVQCSSVVASLCLDLRLVLQHDSIKQDTGLSGICLGYLFANMQVKPIVRIAL